MFKQDEKKITMAGMKYSRRVTGVSRSHKVRNDRIRGELKIESMEDFIEYKHLGWWGHL